MELIGYQNQWEFLSREVRNLRVSQAYLFSGPAEIGKRKMALELLKLLNTNVRGFNQAFSRIFRETGMIEKNIFPDLYFVQPQNQDNSTQVKIRGKDISITQIRNLRDFLRFKAQISRFKMAIVDNAERMTIDAQNSLLKTLEEPKEQTILVLITSQENSLLATVRSRTRILRFSPLSSLTMEKAFQGKISPEKLQDLIFLAQGRPGRAIKLLKNPKQFQAEVEMIKTFPKLFSSPYLIRFQFVKDLLKENSKFPAPKEFLDICLIYFRWILLKEIGLGQNIPSTLVKNSYLLGNLNLEQVKKIIEFLEKLKVLLAKTNLNSKLALETFMTYV